MLLKALQRYWAKVEKCGPDDCWPWKGSRNTAGYGQIGAGTGRKQSYYIATHVALAIDGRDRPSKFHVAMHSCDRPWCVNPRHLRWGTHAENMADMRAKGRAPWQGGAPERYDPDLVAYMMDTKATELAVGRGARKLTLDQVRYIRSSNKSTVALSKELGVSNQCIGNVRRGLTWKEVETLPTDFPTTELTHST